MEVTDGVRADSLLTLLSSNRILATLTLASVCAGIATAVGLWHAEHWARWSYLIWLGIYFVAAVASDTRVESVIWKVLLGAMLVSFFPGIGAVYLFRVYKRS